MALSVVYMDGSEEVIEQIVSFYTTSNFLVMDRGNYGRWTLLLSVLRGWKVRP